MPVVDDFDVPVWSGASAGRRRSGWCADSSISLLAAFTTLTPLASATESRSHAIRRRTVRGLT